MGETPGKQRMENSGVMERVRPAHGVVSRFQSLTPPQFRQQIDETWAAATYLKDTLVDLVEGIEHQGQEAKLDPITALGVIGCVNAQLFGYNAFHGQPSPADLISAVSPASRDSSN